MLFQPLPQSQRQSGAEAILDRSKQHSDDTEWVISARPSLSQRPGFLTGEGAALRSTLLRKQQELQRERNQGKLFDAAGKTRENLNIAHYEERLNNEGALPDDPVFSNRVHEYFTERTDKSAGSHAGETRREALQENLDSNNVAFYSQGPSQEQPQQLSQAALKERIRLSKIHETRTKHEARILAGAEMEEQKKQQQQDRRLQGIARQKYNHIAINQEKQDRQKGYGHKKSNLSGLHKNFGPSSENTTLPGLQSNKENMSNRSQTTGRSGLSTARLLTGGAVAARPVAQRNQSSLFFNDYN